MRICIVRLSSLGDILHSLPLVPLIKSRYPRSHLSWVVESRYVSALRPFPQIDEIIPLDFEALKKNWFRPQIWLAVWRRARELGKSGIDVSIDSQGLFRSALVTAFLRAPKRIGFSFRHSREWSWLFYNTRPAMGKEINVVKKNIRLLQGIDIRTEELPRPVCVLSKEAIKFVDDFLRPLKPKFLVLVNPWSSVPNKCLPLPNLEDLIRGLVATYGEKPILMFGPGEEKKARRLAQDLPVHLQPPTSLERLYALIQRADVYFGCDSGPTYISALLGRPTICLFGPTNSHRQAFPYANLKSLYSSYDCPIIHSPPIRPPYRCLDKRCGDNQCMKKYESAPIIQAAKSFWKEKQMLK